MNETLDLGTNESIFGKIKFIAGNDVTAETKASAEEMGDLMNTHVVFEAPDQLILGEVDEVNDGFIKIRLLGEFHEGKYVSGVIRKPVMNSLIRLINNEELNAIVQAKQTAEEIQNTITKLESLLTQLQPMSERVKGLKVGVENHV